MTLHLSLRATRRLDQLNVLVCDARRPGFSAEFEVAGIAVTAIRLSLRGPLDLGAVRDLPLITWGRAASVAATWVVADAEVAVRLDATEPGDLVAVTADDLRRVRAQYVESYDRRPAARTPADARHAAALHRYAAIAADHALRVLAGSADPAGEVAREYQAPATSVRTWLHRARQHGIDPTRPAEPAQDPMVAPVGARKEN